jgi:two-component system OmpR family response regulator
MRVLVVEDDAKIASFVVRGLKQAGYAVDHAPTARPASPSPSPPTTTPIVDVMLPRLDGISLVKRLRAARRVTPVLFLSAKSSVDDRIRGLQAGGDDYLTKPFAFSELLARVHALIRRATSQSPEATRLVSGDVTLDLVTREVTRAGEPVELQPREFSLLAFLLRHAGRPVSKTMILEHVWDYSFDPQTNVVDVVMSRLRAKIDPDHTRLETVRGVGYVFRPHA